MGRRPYRARSNNAAFDMPILQPSDLGTAEQLEHVAVVAIRTASGTIEQRAVTGVEISDRVVSDGGLALRKGARKRIENPLDLLLEVGLLDGDGPDAELVGRRRHHAGLRLSALFERGRMQPRMSARYEKGGYGGCGEKSDAEAEAEMRYLRAQRYLGQHACIVQDTACLGNTPRPAHMAGLKAGLDLLVEYWGERGDD